MTTQAEERSQREECNLTWLNSFIKTQKEDERLLSVGRQRRSDCRKGFQGAPEKLSPFHERVFLMLGLAGGGLWNAPILWKEIRWNGDNMLTIPVGTELATFDNTILLSLVSQGARYGIRLAIKSRYMKMEILFTAMGGSDGMNRIHPSLADMTSALSDATQTCGGCRFFEELFNNDDEDADAPVSGKCLFPRTAMPLALTHDSDALDHAAYPLSSWTGCGCWTAKGHEFDITTEKKAKADAY